jgi:hypothetical protein
MADTDDSVQRVEGDNVSWVEVASCGSIDEANLLRGFLEAEGIGAQIENVQSDVLPANFGKLGDIRIFVASEDEPRAQALMKERELAYDKLDDDGETVVTDEGASAIDDDSTLETEPE